MLDQIENETFGSRREPGSVWIDNLETRKVDAKNSRDRIATIMVPVSWEWNLAQLLLQSLHLIERKVAKVSSGEEMRQAHGYRDADVQGIAEVKIVPREPMDGAAWFESLDERARVAWDYVLVGDGAEWRGGGKFHLEKKFVELLPHFLPGVYSSQSFDFQNEYDAAIGPSRYRGPNAIL
jgi:hypothetical protein